MLFASLLHKFFATFNMFANIYYKLNCMLISMYFKFFGPFISYGLGFMSCHEI